METTLIDLPISAASFAYPAVAGDDRARYATSLGAIGASLTRLAEAGISAFVLSTCLRIEVVVHGPKDHLDGALLLLFGDTEPIDGIHRSGTVAVEHVFRVAAGLESPILGEREILTQFRQATACAAEHGAANGPLLGLLDAAIATARAARRHLPVDPARSMASIAATLVADTGRVGILGHGTMGRSVAEALLARPEPPTVEIFARRPEKVDTPGAVVRPLTEAPEAFHTHPAIVSATSAKTRLIPTDTLRALLARRVESLLLVDMAMPPDLDPPEGVPVRYVDIDDLADLARETISPIDADRFVAAAAADYVQRVRTRAQAGALIRSLFDRADVAAAEAVDRFAGKLTRPEDRPLLEQVARATVRKLLHHPVRYIGEGNDDTFDVIASAFGILDDD